LALSNPNLPSLRIDEIRILFIIIPLEMPSPPPPGFSLELVVFPPPSRQRIPPPLNGIFSFSAPPYNHASFVDAFPLAGSGPERPPFQASFLPDVEGSEVPFFFRIRAYFKLAFPPSSSEVFPESRTSRLSIQILFFDLSILCPHRPRRSSES